MEISQRTKKSWKIFDISGNIRRKGAQIIKDLCSECIEDSKIRIVANFKNVKFIDSVGLGSLIFCNQNLKSIGGELVLMNLNENIYDLLEMTSVDRLFTIVDSEADLPL
jgi:anti-sigma B factor antagonist